MNPESDTPNSAPPALSTHTDEINYTATSIVFLLIVGIASLIVEGSGDSQSNWANHLGSGLAFGVLSVVTASIILMFRSGFPKNRTMWRIFVSNLAIPMMFTGALWLWRANSISVKKAEKEDEKAEYAKLDQETIREEQQKQRIKQEADLVIRSAKIMLDDQIRRFISEIKGAIRIDGWSASPLGGGTWLVKFVYSINGSDKWLLYEYNDYLHDFRLVFSDNILKGEYLKSDEDGASFNEATLRKMGDWYGPIR